eukprot:6272452-Amphidinium_carterae.1
MMLMIPEGTAEKWLEQASQPSAPCGAAAERGLNSLIKDISKKYPLRVDWTDEKEPQSSTGALASSVPKDTVDPESADTD